MDLLAIHAELEELFPPDVRKLRTPEYLRMVERIVDEDETTTWGASVMGDLEYEIWRLFRAVPTREMFLLIRGCRSMESALRAVDEVTSAALRDGFPRPLTPARP